MRLRGLAIAGAALALLAGCTTPTPRPAPPTPVVSPAPPEPPPPAATVAAPPAPVTAAATPWQRLRASFAMDDCVAPALRQAQRETRNAHGFEARLRAALPLIDYIEHVAARHDVAGEFVMLPWVESHFHQTPPGHHGSAGMWQIVRITADANGLRTTRRYDGRLDPVASTAVVMRLLAGYHRQWHDWRLVDMAYNTGATRLRRIVKAHGVPPAKPVVPKLPVSGTTRHHLVKLLAIACVIRDPARFHVQLPVWDPNERLQVVKLPGPAHLRDVATLAHLPLAHVRKLNAGYRRGTVTARSPMQLLLPGSAAQALREAIAAGRLSGAADVAGTDAPATYTVGTGDTLWGIAHRFHVDLDQLRQWNHLHGDDLHPGQVLQLESPSAG